MSFINSLKHIFTSNTLELDLELAIFKFKNHHGKAYDDDIKKVFEKYFTREEVNTLFQLRDAIENCDVHYAVFNKLTHDLLLEGYSIEDKVIQMTLLDATKAYKEKIDLEKKRDLILTKINSNTISK